MSTPLNDARDAYHRADQAAEEAAGWWEKFKAARRLEAARSAYRQAVEDANEEDDCRRRLDAARMVYTVTARRARDEPSDANAAAADAAYFTLQRIEARRGRTL